jgi:hypothetical protein
VTTTGGTSIALDLVGGKMYWPQTLADKIQRANLDGTGIEDLVTTGTSVPQGIALDIASGKMYWGAQGANKVSRANLDGSGVEILLQQIRPILTGSVLTRRQEKCTGPTHSRPPVAFKCRILTERECRRS